MASFANTAVANLREAADLLRAEDRRSGTAHDVIVSRETFEQVISRIHFAIGQLSAIREAAARAPFPDRFVVEALSDCRSEVAANG